MPFSQAHKADFLLLVVTLLAAISWMFSREAVLAMPPLLFMSLRFLLASLLLSLVAFPQLARLTTGQLWRCIRVGLVFGVAMCFWVLGLAFATHVGEGAFLTSLGVVLVPVIARVVFAEPVPGSTWLALPVAVAGLALLSLEQGLQLEAGQLLFITAAAIFALYFNLNTRAANTLAIRDSNGHTVEQPRIPALALTTVVLAVVGVVTGSLSLYFEPWQDAMTQMQGELVMWIVLSATVGTAMRFLVQTYAQSLSLHSHGVVIMVLEPMWTALMAALWFGESMTALQGVGCGLIFLSLLVNRWRAVRRMLRLG
ncbi:MAG: DMT family transporter [Pseudomonadota bacterium]|uniref:DMT family transporter n=1 Tax=Alcanivorax sp. TaxID=1872427 RepID=UPI002438C0B1|nr:DMT family transporter [Alcanivorax sp.]MED5239427.1 DMT family transporter [Pseudomonadota bacterium]MEE3322003.1 DMT family transporter [Pseudomonadota bacterium]